jgi:phosphatidate cytidylyltransferase
MGKISRNNLITRGFTGAGFVIAILGAVILSYYIFSILFLIITLLALYEFLSIHGNKKVGLVLPPIIAGAIAYLSVALAWFGLIPENLLLINFLLIPLLLITSLYSKSPIAIRDISLALFSLVYIALPLATLNLLFFKSTTNFQSDLLIGFFVVIWTYDSFAYLTGVTFGRHRLFERISPKKSWEGTLGGFVFGLIAAWVVAAIFSHYTIGQWLVFAIIIMVFGTFGDLLESLLKRSLNIKDSGKVLPGHGGLLDRFDAVLLAAPAAVVYVHLILLK